MAFPRRQFLHGAAASLGQQAPAGLYGVLIILGRARQPLTRFRTIQVCPKDLRVLRRQAKMR